MAHTPGPWRVDASYDIPVVIAHCFPNGSTCVAVVYGDNDAIMARVPGARVQDSILNARLIAAAPDLLAALKALASVCGFEHDDEDLQRALAAIKKAETE